METDEANFSQGQSFELIESMIKKAKDRFNKIAILTAAVVIAWIIPGYTLREKFKKQTN